MRTRSCRRASLVPKRGFTLLELLVVLAITAVMATLALYGMRGLLDSGNLRSAASSVAGTIDLARQSAGARNLSVDLRLYQDMAKPRDANGNPPFCILALVVPASASGAASDEFLMAPLRMPGNVVIDSNLQFSSILNTTLGTSGLQPIAGTEPASAPSAVRNLPYIQFIFLANGTINLDSTQKWCLTLVNGNQIHSSSSSSPAPDFATLVLDVQTARASLYQP